VEQQIIEIFLFEDNQEDAILAQYLLAEIENLDYSIRHVKRLSQGLELLLLEKPDIILLDLNLPDSNGLETFAAVNEIAGGVPIIIMSGLTDKDLALTAVQMGAQDYLIKGQINSQLLFRSILYAIERQNLMTKLKEALEQVKALEGLLPICCYCKDIKNERGLWLSIESYIQRHSDARFSHGICPKCAEKYHQEIFGRKNTEE